MTNSKKPNKQTTRASFTELDESDLQAIEGGANTKGSSTSSTTPGSFKSVDGLSAEVAAVEGSSKPSSVKSLSPKRK